MALKPKYRLLREIFNIDVVMYIVHYPKTFCNYPIL